MRFTRFGHLDRRSHAASGPPENLYTAENIDRHKAGQVSPRDGLARPDSFTGLVAVEGASGTLQVDETSVTFAKPIRSMIDVDTARRGPPNLPFTE